MTTALLSVAFLAQVASAGSAASARAETIAFAPVAGSRVDKTFTLEHELVVQKMRFEGEEGAQLSQQRLEVSSKISLHAIDTYRAVEGGRPLVLQRLYPDAGLHVDLVLIDARGEKHPDAWDAESPLKGTSVVFTWVPEDQGYGRYFDQRETLEEYLGGLAEDIDLRGLLPGRQVREGDAWPIEPARLADVFAAGGNVPMAFVKGGGGFFARSVASGVGGPLSEVFGGEVKGKAQAKWKETREQEGVRLAVVEISVEIETSRDQTASARAAMRLGELLEERTIQHAGVTWKFKGEGALVWNLSAGRFESFDLGGREDVASDLSLGFGGETSSHQELSFAGSLKLSAKVAAKKN
jgi:hypothetical protein